ncbi:trichohyalin-like [Halichondria panicea]|uniref:trichohyalin-like n=1 Tax=Halichondria panicea TaxID=6063 RepID=UPI00312B4A13
MALVEEDLPGVNKVRSDFQVREDESLAHRLQEEEFDDHYNSNVQVRRTARVDANVAIGMQKAEVDRFKAEEQIRRRELEEKEERDKEHAAQLARKIKEEEEVHRAMKMQDEIMAKKLFEQEQETVIKRKRQEQEDSRFARQSSLHEEQSIRERRQKELQLSEQEARRLEMEEGHKLERKRRDQSLSETEARRLYELQKQALERKKREQSLSEDEVRRMRQLELGAKGASSPHRGSPSQGGPASLPPGGSQRASQRGNPSASLPPGALSNATRHHKESVDYVGSPSSSIGASSVPGGEDFQLPSYDDLVGGNHDDEEEEHVMDENERIALQEAEDERMARQLAHGVDGAERERREREDMEFARKLLEQESKGKQKTQSPHHQDDVELARRLQQQEVASRQKMKQQRAQSLDQPAPTLPGEDAASLELARRLQREEVMRHRQLKQQKLAQQRVMSEAEAQKRHTPPMEPTRQQQTFPQPSRSQQPKETKPPPKQVQYSSQTARSSATQSPVHTQGPPQAGNPEQSVLTAYQPAMTGYQVPLASHTGSVIPQARPSYKRDPGKKKGKK